MDRRLIFNGGEINPTNDELNLMPNSNRGGIHALGAAMAGGENSILTGINAVIGASSVTFSDGYVFLNGEVLKVVGATVNDTVGNDLYIFQKNTNTTNPDFIRNYRDGSVHNVAEINTAVVVPVASIGSNLSVQGRSVSKRIEKSRLINCGSVRISSFVNGVNTLVNTPAGDILSISNVVGVSAVGSVPDRVTFRVLFKNARSTDRAILDFSLQSFFSDDPIEFLPSIASFRGPAYTFNTGTGLNDCTIALTWTEAPNSSVFEFFIRMSEVDF
jgi:hypothetical protein